MSANIAVIIWALSIGFFAFIQYLNRKTKEDETFVYLLQKLEEYAEIAVRYAKDIGRQGEMTGEEKRLLAVNTLMRFRDILGLEKVVTDEQLEQLIRSAYTVMYNEDESATYIIE